MCTYRTTRTRTPLSDVGAGCLLARGSSLAPHHAWPSGPGNGQRATQRECNARVARHLYLPPGDMVTRRRHNSRIHFPAVATALCSVRHAPSILVALRPVQKNTRPAGLTIFCTDVLCSNHQFVAPNSAVESTTGCRFPVKTI